MKTPLPADVLLSLYSHYLQSGGVSTDTRRIQPGVIFFALKGPNFNGNRFAAQALASGASLAVIDEMPAEGLPEGKFLLVPDALYALQLLAQHHRRQLKGKVLGLTGSNGKTTTKELLNSVLNTQLACAATHGNLNNHIGLPLTLLSIRHQPDWIVLEMGDNQPGDIQELCEIAEPDYGMITNIGWDHVGNYGGFEANAACKLELFDYVKTMRRGTLFQNMEDTILAGISSQKFVSYGFKNADLTCKIIENRLDGLLLEVDYVTWPGKIKVESRLGGVHNAMNILAAIAVAVHAGITQENIQAGITAYVPQNNRSQVVYRNGKTLLLDAYNANPSSMEVAIATACAENSGTTLLVLGDMMELGDLSQGLHEKVGRLVAAAHPGMFVAVGQQMTDYAAPLVQAAGIPVRTYPATAAAAAELGAVAAPFASILFKGSRSMALEQLAELL